MAKKLTTEEFIKRAKEVHGDKYDYSKTDLDNRDEKGRVIIICPIHGEFKQKPTNHINNKQGCGKCATYKLKLKLRLTKDKFINKSKEIHCNKYTYTKVEYINEDNEVIITCPIHGDFPQKPKHHLRGKGCPKCAHKNLTNDEWIEIYKKIHCNKYDYSKTKFIGKNEEICIICPIHGEFFQTHSCHLQGKGCQKCGYDKNIKENELKKILIKKYKNIEYQKKFKWLGRQTLDFYLPKHNIAIELQGKQHFKPIKMFGGDERFEKQIERDWRKIKLCEQNGVKLLHFAFLKEKEFENCGYEVINDVDKLISIIKESVE